MRLTTNVYRRSVCPSPGLVLVDGDAAVDEADDADHGGGRQHIRVVAQPREVHRDLHAWGGSGGSVTHLSRD